MVNLYILGKKGLIALSKLKAEYLSLVSSVTIGSDKNIENDYSSYIIQKCNELNLEYVVQNKTSNNVAPHSIAIGWRFLINDESNLIVFHDSLLPKYRGFNPLVTALINGDKKVGATALKASKEYDRGDIIEQRVIEINYPIKISEVIDSISLEYTNLLNSIFNKLISNNLKSYPQDENLASYSLWRDDGNYRINWSLDANTIKRFIDAVGFPYKGAYSLIENQKVIIRDSEVVEDVEIPIRETGKVIFKYNNIYTIVCGKGLLRVRDFYDHNGEPVKLKNFRIRFK